MLTVVRIPLHDSSAFVAAGNRIRFLARDLGIQPIRAARLAVAVSELCREASGVGHEASLALGLSPPPAWGGHASRAGGMTAVLETTRVDVDVLRLRAFFHALRSLPQPESGLLIEAFYAAERPDFRPDADFQRREQARLERYILPTRAELKYRATHDGLTGIYNRIFFQEKIEDEVRRSLRYGTPLSLLMMDIDHFKAINDTYGHQAGDACLSAVAALIRRLPRQVDTAARYGGEEFAVILPHTDIDQARHLAERIRQAVKDMRIPFGQHVIRLTVSIGIGCLDRGEGPGPEALIRAADQALYAAKEGGRNRVCTCG